MVPNQENVEGDQPVQRHRHAKQPLQPQTFVQEHCAGETGLPSSVFQAVHEMCLVLFLQSPEFLIHAVWVYLEGNNAVSIHQEWLNLMHAKFHCCGTTQPMNFSAHPRRGFR